ncbi:MAG: thermonuclease family protein, partial [Pseudomonadota bacterium]
DVMIGEEEKARLSGVGLWQTTFQEPWEFRQQQWRATEQQSADSCQIKGNINHNGEQIYHTPWGSKHYERTKIDVSRGERWFCDENEARKAGWRPAFH